ncbi:hypothetical protein ACROYT_G039960 [Oculina patagonica]
MAALSNTKLLPCSEEELRKIASQYRTPFYLYDKERMVNRAKFFYESFAWVHSLTGTSFMNHFAVKATPTPMILKMLHEECNMGMDCSSLGELMLCEKLGIKGEDVMFTSNNTPLAEYRKAFEMGAIINLDDYSQIDNLKKALGGTMPDMIAFRFNPGQEHDINYNEIIGNPVEAKFGLTKAQLFAAYKKCKEYGVKRFGLHTMMLTNSLNILDLAETARMMFTLAVDIKNETGISVELVNLGGGIGVNYHRDDKLIDLQDLGLRVRCLYEEIVMPHRDLHPLQIKYECGRVVTAENGWLVSRVINMKDTYKRFLGVDASMADFSLPGIYGKYHVITVVKDQPLSNDVQKDLPDYKTVVNDPSYACPNHKGDKRERMFDIVGSICMSTDKFAVNRVLNVNPEIGDLCIFHSAGAYGYSTGYNFNAKLQPAEILRVSRNRFEMIRRAQTYDDYFATMKFP